MLNQISLVQLDCTKMDILHWRWTTHHHFTVHSLYEWLNYGGILTHSFDTIWCSKIPLKIKIFLWLVKQNKIHTKVNLSKKGWSGNTGCHFCDQPETTSHLFVTCPMIYGIWNWITYFNNFAYDCNTIEDLWIIDAKIPFKDRQLIEMVRGSVLWTVWLNRNVLAAVGPVLTE